MGDASDADGQVVSAAWWMDGVEIASGYMGNTDLAVQRLIWEKLFGMKVGELFRLRAAERGRHPADAAWPGQQRLDPPR